MLKKRKHNETREPFFERIIRKYTLRLRTFHNLKLLYLKLRLACGYEPSKHYFFHQNIAYYSWFIQFELYHVGDLMQCNNLVQCNKWLHHLIVQKHYLQMDSQGIYSKFTLKNTLALGIAVMLSWLEKAKVGVGIKLVGNLKTALPCGRIDSGASGRKQPASTLVFPPTMARGQMEKGKLVVGANGRRTNHNVLKPDSDLAKIVMQYRIKSPMTLITKRLGLTKLGVAAEHLDLLKLEQQEVSRIGDINHIPNPLLPVVTARRVETPIPAVSERIDNSIVNKTKDNLNYRVSSTIEQLQLKKIGTGQNAKANSEPSPIVTDGFNQKTIQKVGQLQPDLSEQKMRGTTSQVEINNIAERVCQMLEKKMMVKKDRWGLLS